MKKLILASAFIAAGTFVSAQCTPNQLYADSVYGVWPDTTSNFMPGVVGEFYSDTLNILVPSDASLIDPTYPNIVVVDSIHLVGVDGLPAGINVICNSHTSNSCTFLSTVLGCGLLEGTPTQAGTFPLVLNVRGFATVPFLGQQEVDLSFTGYQLVISDNGTGIIGHGVAGISGVRNVPNPFATRTNIEFTSGRAGTARVRVVNLVGVELWNELVQAKVGVNRVPFDGGQRPAGVYLYNIESGSNSYTGRMAVQR